MSKRMFVKRRDVDDIWRMIEKYSGDLPEGIEFHPRSHPSIWSRVFDEATRRGLYWTTLLDSTVDDCVRKLWPLLSSKGIKPTNNINPPKQTPTPRVFNRVVYKAPPVTPSAKPTSKPVVIIRKRPVQRVVHPVPSMQRLTVHQIEDETDTPYETDVDTTSASHNDLLSSLFAKKSVTSEVLWPDGVRPATPPPVKKTRPLPEGPIDTNLMAVLGLPVPEYPKATSDAGSFCGSPDSVSSPPLASQIINNKDVSIPAEQFYDDLEPQTSQYGGLTELEQLLRQSPMSHQYAIDEPSSSAPPSTSDFNEDPPESLESLKRRALLSSIKKNDVMTKYYEKLLCRMDDNQTKPVVSYYRRL